MKHHVRVDHIRAQLADNLVLELWTGLLTFKLWILKQKLALDGHVRSEGIVCILLEPKTDHIVRQVLPIERRTARIDLVGCEEALHRDAHFRVFARGVFEEGSRGRRREFPWRLKHVHHVD